MWYDKDGKEIADPKEGEKYFDKDGKETLYRANPDDGQKSEVQEQIKKLQEQVTSLEREKKGIYGDLKSEKERRQDLERRIQEKERLIDEKKDLIESLADDEYITGKHLKDIRRSEQEKTAKIMRDGAVRRGEERMADDENRMSELCELNPKKYPVSYVDAIKEFEALANEDSSLWEEVDKAKYTPGGRPAEIAYKIALRESPKFQEMTRKKTREELLEEIENQGRSPRRLSGSSGGGKSIERLSDSDIHHMTDEELQRALRS